ncbi:MAG: efflux RND transporter permease subunit [Planctomycetota bacterium]|jgi:multidrug efflux pump subunit AcrB
MRSIVRWAIDNSPAMNTLMVCILVVGFISGAMLRREEFPRFELEIILVSMPYPGASPDEVENGVCQKIEEAVRGIDGIKKVTSVAMENSGNVIIECKSDVPSVQKILNEVESEINRIPSFPDLAEEPEIKQLTIRNPAIKIGVMATGNQAADAELQLRDIVEGVRDDLLLIPEISVADIQGEKDYQIDIEISETTLRKYGLTLQEVARRVRAQNLELPGGKVKADSQEFLLRGKNKRVRGEDIAQIPLIATVDGLRLTVNDLGTVDDGFVDTTSLSWINGNPGLAISVEAAAGEDLIAMTQAVREYAETQTLPEGYEFAVWADRSVEVNERLELLKRNGTQGLILVFLVLALFLEFRLAFWVALGIPISVLGACGVLMQLDQTLNMLSMFAFLIALGIVVDDAIVIGENIYAHRERGKPFVQAALDGAVEVFPSVATSVTSTIFAFLPMMYVTGVMGKFFAVLPVAVIAMLVISLVESVLILPCHLAHGKNQRDESEADKKASRMSRLRALDARINGSVSGFLQKVINDYYQPTLLFCLRHPAIACATAIALFIGSLSLTASGAVPWIIFPKLDAKDIEAKVIFPDGTPSHVTEAATRRLEQAIQEVAHESADAGQTIIRDIFRNVGSVSSQSPGGPAQLTEGGHAGVVQVALVDNQQRDLTSDQIVERWRQQAGEFAGAETLSFGSLSMGPGGRPIEFKLLAAAEDMPQLEAAIEECKEKLATYDGVFDIADDSSPGKWELQIKVQPDAEALGVPLQAIAGSVRSAYYGEEVMRIQRGRHEVKIMVRYPADERRSLANLRDLRVDTGDGVKRPLSELADVNVTRSYSEINRVNQKRSITITADLDEEKANAAQIVRELQSDFMPELVQNYPGVGVRWEGQQEQSVESMQSLLFGLAIAMLATFALLTLEFRSYIQPAIVMAVIPFGLIGALWGHALMGLPLTMFSLMGLVALTGVVVNDSIVLVDFINHRVRDGVPLKQAIIESGQRRFRPVILTSLTTVAGLLPILTETSLQAQILIPMANSLCFGLILATALVLLLVPTLYRIYGALRGIEMDFDED